MVDGQITNASVYLQSLSEEDRKALQVQVERQAITFLLARAPGEEVIIDTMCRFLGFNLAHRRILNGLLRQLAKAEFGKLILGRKGHSTKFVTWKPIDLLVTLSGPIYKLTTGYGPGEVDLSTVLSAVEWTKRKVLDVIEEMDRIVAKGQ